jgi:hypothetical protein
MIERALLIKDGLVRYFAKFDSKLPIDANDSDKLSMASSVWEDFSTILDFLKPFQEATEQMASDEYIILSSVLPWYNGILGHIEDSQTTADPASALFRATNGMMAQIKDSYHISKDFCTIATILDPRFKLYYFQQTGIEPEEINRIRSLVQKTYDDNYAAKKVSNVVHPLGVWPFFKKVRLDEKTRNEFLEYCNFSVVTSDPLCWWRQHEAKFPNLAAMAKDYLVVPGSSAPNEWDFSASRQLITNYSCEISWTARTQCLKSWIRNCSD